MTTPLCPACSAPLRGFARRCSRCDWTQPPAVKPAPAEPASEVRIPDYVAVRRHLADADRHLTEAIDRRRTGAHASGAEADRQAAIYYRACADVLDPEGRA